jgi:hypothetical protein
MSSTTSRIPLVLLAFLFFSAVATPAVAVPSLPYELYGAITIDNIPAPVGTEVTAKIDGQPVGSIFVKESGFYGGGSGTFDERLYIQANEEDIGKYITFWVGDRQATKITQMQAGISQNLDLSFIIGEEGSIDVSLPPTPVGTVPAPTQSPLMAAPLLGLLAAAALVRSRQK